MEKKLSKKGKITKMKLKNEHKPTKQYKVERKMVSQKKIMKMQNQEIKNQMKQNQQKQFNHHLKEIQILRKGKTIIKNLIIIIIIIIQVIQIFQIRIP